MAEQDKHAANRVLLLRRGHPVFALVEAVRELSDELKAASLSWGAHRDKYLVPIALQEDLYLVIKKPNSVSLHGCKCSAPVRGAEECLSLNEACTRILQAYKPHVRSHTGNAFLIVRYERYPAMAQQELFATLAPLSELREEKVRTYEASLRFRRAITSALNFHREQTRKGGTVPYISHVLAVTSIVQEHGGTEDQAIAALLHDAVDNGDGHAALEDIERKFSRRVADIVEGCADTLIDPKPDWRERKEAFVRRLESASDSVRLVVGADKLHNARGLLDGLRSQGDDVWRLFEAGREQTLWYYRSVADVLKKAGPHLLAHELDRVVGELERTAQQSRPTLRLNGLATEANYQALLGLTGLQPLKDLVERDISLVLHNQRLRRLGVDSGEHCNPPVSLVLTGNPGTGKTKVARMLGAIYKSLGLLTKGHVVEVSRAHLIGDVIGATEKKTLEAITRAQGGILFIDEAYSLAGKSRNDFGVEAIEVLLKAMGDSTGDFGVIVAGYPEPMRVFLASNPGLRSRFQGREVHLDDYTPAELLAIAQAAIHKLQLAIDADALEYLKARLENAYRSRDSTFGNARWVKGVVNDSKASLARRLRGAAEGTPFRDLVSLTLADIRAAFETTAMPAVATSIDEGELVKALSDLDALTGIPAVKQEIAELVDLVRYYRSVGKSPERFLNSHFAFTGNPGTGKTTVARILGRIFRALGLLERGHLVECDRQDLVAQWVGQTAPKTSALIDKAIGGMLFIDEAYALVPLTNSDFGPEAIQVLLKRMEDQHGQFVVVVAGYPDEMAQFLASNPGLKSRFDTFISFEDYSGDELTEIAERLFADEGIVLEMAAHQVVHDYCRQYARGRDRQSGNARDIRKLVQKSVRNQHLRIARSQSPRTDHRVSPETPSAPDTANLGALTAQDLSNWTTPPSTKRRAIGFTSDE